MSSEKIEVKAAVVSVSVEFDPEGLGYTLNCQGIYARDKEDGDAITSFSIYTSKPVRPGAILNLSIELADNPDPDWFFVE